MTPPPHVYLSLLDPSDPFWIFVDAQTDAPSTLQALRRPEPRVIAAASEAVRVFAWIHQFSLGHAVLRIEDSDDHVMTLDELEALAS